MRVNCICPEFVDTNMVQEVLQFLGEDAREGLIRYIGRIHVSTTQVLDRALSWYNISHTTVS